VARLLVAEVSQRECARVLKINKKTVVRKMRLMSVRAQEKLLILNLQRPKIKILEFDDMETFEHTKCKPVSITIAVESETRWIAGYRVSSMAANGLLAQISVKKYGKRADDRFKSRESLFAELTKYVESKAVIKSDENPHYISTVKRYFPQSEHKQYKGRRAAVVGQGELKKIGFDPLFSLNHACATLRARMSRLIRKTWCTTKTLRGLREHLDLAILHHNLNLKMNSKKATLLEPLSTE
jgi:hypothetical protein